MGLLLPVLAAIAVGVAAVVITGGGGAGGAAPPALDAGFPPARIAVADFGGGSPASRVVLAAVAASAATEVVAGSALGGPAVWVSANGGSTWQSARLLGPSALTSRNSGLLSAVAHGQAGWLAVGSTQAGTGGPLVIGSPDATTWTVAAGAAGLRAPGATATAVAAGLAGYVITGHRGAVGAAWYSAGLTGWHAATIEPAGSGDLAAVTATADGFAAVGGSAGAPAAWVSSTGSAWRQVVIARPAGVASAALDFVAAAGREVVAVGTAIASGGSQTPFAEVSADSGATWTPAPLPLPGSAGSVGTAGTAAATALTVAGGGFTVTGTVSASGSADTDVVVWTVPAGATPGTAWTVAAPQGTGLAGAGTQNAVTGLTAQGATLTGVGFTAALAGGGYGAQRPTLWQSPIRP
jgi:hypothetical protein